MQVKITADVHRGHRGYQGVILELPTDRFCLADAMERARVPDGGGYELHRFNDWPGFLKCALIMAGDKTLEEVNFLADKVSGMNEEEFHVYEGILKQHHDSEQDPMTMKELINAVYKLECFEFYPGVTNHYELGEICMQSEMPDWIQELPDEVFAMLDAGKVGESICRSEQGAFTEAGYVFRSSPDGPEVYDGIHLPEQNDRHDGVIALRLIRADSGQAADAGVWLELPADEQAIRQALHTLGETNLDACVIAEAESIVPALKFQLAGDEDIRQLNTLAERITAFPDSRTLAKYKAVLMVEDCCDLDMVLDIANNLDCYDFDPQIMSPGQYAEYILKEAGFDPDDPAFCGFDFHDYGKRQLQESGYMATAYGTVIRNDQPFIHEYTKPQEQGMIMQ